MREGKKEKCLIVGGGLVGSLQAIYLAKRGYEVEVYERSEDVFKFLLNFEVKKNEPLRRKIHQFSIKQQRIQGIRKGCQFQRNS
jgi:flavin-dependent dehydrogenase